MVTIQVPHLPSPQWILVPTNPAIFRRYQAKLVDPVPGKSQDIGEKFQLVVELTVDCVLLPIYQERRGSC